jgi:hypothetical protein
MANELSSLDLSHQAALDRFARKLNVIELRVRLSLEADTTAILQGMLTDESQSDRLNELKWLHHLNSHELQGLMAYMTFDDNK